MPETRNRLAGNRSPYLRAAANQPVDWYPWGEEAFARARAENKPVLLDIGAAWCHWCHVLDHESYEDPDVARLINERFVPVKVDRDERPDIDARYQQAVQAIAGQGGWPLTAFLTPEGRVFYGGTYFPPDDWQGRPGFRRVLAAVAETYANEPARVTEFVDRLSQSLAPPSSPAAIGETLVGMAVERAGAAFDIANGGFGGAPKFPHTSTIELVLRACDRSREDWQRQIVTRTLDKMAAGGIRDHLGGGFHRYSTDAKWIVPHFEKMLYDNAGLLRNYAQAYRAFGTDVYRQVGQGIVAYLLGTLADRERGGFYGSQDADVGGPQDEGGYFTWTVDEAEAACTPDVWPAVQLHFDIGERGEMHHDPRKNVLHVAREPAAVAELLRITQAEAGQRIERGTAQLRAARERREAPFVDTTLYANWNAMAISAFFEAAVAFDDPGAASFARKTLDRFLREARTADGGFSHVLSDRGGELPGLLDDQAQMLAALLDAYEHTGERSYLAAAREIAEYILREFEDLDGGFLDIAGAVKGLGHDAPHKPVQDAPTPGANAVAAWALARLWILTEAARYRDAARRTLEAFARLLGGDGLFGGTYHLALDTLLAPQPQAVIVGRRDDPRTRALHRAALHAYRPGAVVSVRDPDDGDAVPSVVAAMVAQSSEPRAYVCAGTSCAPPTSDPDEVARLVREFGR